MRKLMCGLLSGVAFLMVMFLTAGCDDANTPDVPVQPYALAATCQGPSVITDIDASGDYVAVAYEYTGYTILDVTDFGEIRVVDTYGPHQADASCDLVTMDAANGLVFSYLPEDVGYVSRVRDFRSHQPVYYLNASGGTAETWFISRPDTVVIWMTDHSGENVLKRQQIVHRSDTAWARDPNVPEMSWALPPPDVQGFGLSPTGAVAVAYGAGIGFINGNPDVIASTLSLPGNSYDCAWYGNDIVVAAEYAMLIVRVDSLNALHLLRHFIIPKADRLRQVEVDGDYVLLLDEADGIYVVDVSDETAPRVVQEIPFLEPAAFDLENHTLFVGDRVQGLQIFTRN